MEPEHVTHEVITTFLQRLGARWHSSAAVYLLGGAALSLLGNPRATRDLDYTVALPAEQLDAFRRTANAVALELRLDLEEVPSASLCPCRRMRYSDGAPWDNSARSKSSFMISTPSR